MKAALTDIAIKRLKAPEKGQLKVWDTNTPGFGILVGKRTKTFLVVLGKERRNQTIGRYPDISLKDARSEAKKLLASASTRKTPKSFSEAREAFLEDCETRLRQTTIDRYYYSLKTIEASTLDTVPTDITDPNHLKALKVFFNWCIDHQLTDHNPFIRRKVVFGKRERLLTDEEIKVIWSYDYPPYSDMIKALIMTGQRRNQVWKIEDDWLDDETITFPSWIMKSKREHVLPLTGFEKYLAPTAFNSWSKAKVRIDKKIKIQDAPLAPWVIHDLRRYFSSTMAKIGTPLHITEQILDHRATLSGVAAVYNKYDFLPEMKQALKKYQTHIKKVVA